MRLTPEIVEGAYEFLRLLPPFKAWRLPDGDEVEFHVTDHAQTYANCTEGDGGKWIIRVSAKCVGQLSTLLPALAHEMLHIKMQRAGANFEHDGEWEAQASRVCRIHGWDSRAF